MAKHIITVDDLKCVGCGACEADCPASNIKLELTKAAVRSQDCLMCGHCVAVCPVGAVSISGYAEEPVAVPVGERGADGETSPVKTALDPDALETALRFRRSVRRFSRYQERRIGAQALPGTDRFGEAQALPGTDRFGEAQAPPGTDRL